MNASSESGLCAMLISRVLTAVRLDNGSSPRNEWGSILNIAREETLPAADNSGSKHHLDHFRKDEPIESEAERARERMRQHIKPGNAEREQQQLSRKPGDGCPGKGLFPALEDVSCQPRNKRIRHQIPTGKSDDLEHPTWAK